MEKKKRLIPIMITSLFLASGIAVSGLGIHFTNKYKDYKNQIDDLEYEKSIMFAEYKATEAYRKQYDIDLEKYSHAYKNQLISKEEYIERINYIQSNEYTESLIEIESDEFLISRLISLNNQIDNTQSKEKVSYYTAVPTCTIGFFGSAVAGACLALELEKKKEKKGKEEKQTSIKVNHNSLDHQHFITDENGHSEKIDKRHTEEQLHSNQILK